MRTIDKKKFILRYVNLRIRRYGLLIIAITIIISVFLVYNNVRDIYKAIEFLSTPEEKGDLIFITLLDTFYTDLWEFLMLILIPFIGTIIFVQNIEKGIINQYLIQPISRRFFLLAEYMTALLTLLIGIILSFPIGLLIAFLVLGNHFYMSLINSFRFMISSIFLFIFVFNLYLLIILLGILTRESLSTISTYYLIIFFIKLIIPNVFFEGRFPSMITLARFFLGLLTPAGLKNYIGDIFFLSSLFFSMGLISFAISYFMINKIDLY